MKTISTVCCLLCASLGHAQTEAGKGPVLGQGVPQPDTVVNAVSNQENTADVEEEAGRNPFVSFFPRKQEEQVPTQIIDEETTYEEAQAEGVFDYSSLRVSGLIWGNESPRAIINDQIMGIGSVVNDAKIMNISKDGILFDYNGRQYLMKRESSRDKGGS